MSYYSRLEQALSGALHLPLSYNDRYVIISDCHRGAGDQADQFLKNQNLFFAALEHYYARGFSYIELGDGDELWANRSMSSIIEIHSNAFWLMSKFYEQNRLYLIYGNHDLVKRRPGFAERNLLEYTDNAKHRLVSLMPDINLYQGILFEDPDGVSDIFLTHGHQAEALNSVFWGLARFLVRCLWRPLELIGFADPTSAARNNTRKAKVERRLLHFAREEHLILVAGHTHRPMLDTLEHSPYLNTGSCVHPRCITAIEFQNRCFTLVKWTYCTRKDLSVAICREVLAGPVCIEEFR